MYDLSPCYLSIFITRLPASVSVFIYQFYKMKYEFKFLVSAL